MKITNDNLIFRAISSEDDIVKFQSADDDLNDFLKEDALNNQISMLSVTWLVYSNEVLFSYFSLANDSIRKKLIHPGDGESDYEYSHYPALKIARLAVHKEYEGQGIGTAMLVESVSIAFTIAKYAGCRIVTVDAKREAASFYEKYGFKKANTDKDTDTISMYLDLNKMA
jgi:ribosomal protein S18 acetylase RimI-like enzyme